MKKQESFIPALKYRWLTPFYDSLIALAIRESTFKRHLVTQARISSGNKVLDLGCGTATLTLLVKKLKPGAEVFGIDGDLKILEIGKAKARQSGLEVSLDYGLATELPYPDHSFDRVISSLLFHHLTHENKLRAFREVLRVLRPSGELHVADWGKARNALMRLTFFTVQLLDGFATTTENVRGHLPELICEAGFSAVDETECFSTILGTLSLYKAVKPL